MDAATAPRTGRQATRPRRPLREAQARPVRRLRHRPSPAVGRLRRAGPRNRRWPWATVGAVPRLRAGAPTRRRHHAHHRRHHLTAVLVPGSRRGTPRRRPRHLPRRHRARRLPRRRPRPAAGLRVATPARHRPARLDRPAGPRRRCLRPDPHRPEAEAVELVRCDSERDERLCRVRATLRRCGASRTATCSPTSPAAPRGTRCWPPTSRTRSARVACSGRGRGAGRVCCWGGTGTPSRRPDERRRLVALFCKVGGCAPRAAWNGQRGFHSGGVNAPRATT
jgi:hypothetical protein